MKHPTSREQLNFERREYRSDPIEGPEQRHWGDTIIGWAVGAALIVIVGGTLAGWW
jgi:hypothetical protein